jgi:predicted phosphodiesterase
MAKVLVISDTHIPFEHKDYLPFCQRIHKEFKCDTVVHIGDICDSHAISYHEHDPNGMSPIDEMREADKHLKAWFKAFPYVHICKGNHDRMIDRKGKTVGLPDRCFKRFRDIWQLPRGWIDEFQWKIDDVLYEHGDSYSGDMAHLQAAKNNRMNTVIGHTHHNLGVDHTANEKDCLFGCAVGCGIDRKSWAFEYGRMFKKKPILGCGLIEWSKYGSNARVFRMEMK